MTRPILEHVSEAELAKLDESQLAEYYRLVACERWMTSYSAFAQECLARTWPETFDPGVQSALHRYSAILNDYQKTKHTQKTRRNVMIVLPRECCKTELFTIPTIPWLHLHDHEIAGAIVSAVHDDMAVRYTRPIKRTWECEAPEESLRLFGNFYKQGRKWTDEEMTTALRRSNRQDPTLRASSVEKGLVGSHENVVIFDDPTVQMKVNREGDLWHRKVVDAFTDLNTVIRRDGIFVLVCTRWGDNDLPGYIRDNLIAPSVRKAGWITGKAPGQLPPDWEQNWHSYGRYAGWDIIYEQVLERDAATGDEVSKFPVVWPMERIEAVRRDPEKGEAWFAAQLMNDPRVRADNPIQIYHTDRMWIEPEDVPKAAFADLYMCCDIAFKNYEAYKNQTGDYGVIDVFAQAEGVTHLIHGWHGKVKGEEYIARWCDILEWAQVVHKARIHTMTKDAQPGDVGDVIERMFYDAALARGLICPRIVPIRRPGKGDAAARAFAVAPYWQDNRMRLVKGVPGARELVNEMLSIGYGKHDDHLSAAADAFSPEVFKPRAKGVPSSLVDKNAPKSFDWSPVRFTNGPSGQDDDDSDWGQEQQVWR